MYLASLKKILNIALKEPQTSLKRALKEPSKRLNRAVIEP
jgi:hypothetical protein